MNTWCPLFSKIVDSSLWREEDLVVKVFLTMIAKKDADHVVRASAFMIGEWAKKSEAQVLLALKTLSSPDKKRLEPQPFQGRRIEKVAEGWLILNGQFYQDMMRSTNRREYKRQKEFEYYQAKRLTQAQQRRKLVNDGRAERFEKAHGDGEVEKADGIAAEDFPEI